MEKKNQQILHMKGVVKVFPLEYNEKLNEKHVQQDTNSIMKEDRISGLQQKYWR